MPRKPIPLPPLETLESTFHLTASGRLVSKVSRTSRTAGEYADNGVRREYRSVSLGGRIYFAHRVVWALFYKEEPPENIDHINGEPTDNRPANLRAASHAQNMRNKRRYRSNTSGIKGVHKRKDSGLWRAYISCNGKRTHIGQYQTKEEARIALDLARAEMHGEFARAA